jgi:DNA-binding winged helix-turn-helix (wHTH) protein
MHQPAKTFKVSRNKYELQCRRKFRPEHYLSAMHLSQKDIVIYPCGICNGLRLGHVLVRHAAHCEIERDRRRRMDSLYSSDRGGDMPADVVRLGNDLELDRVGFELRRSGGALKLERIPMEILFLLVEQKGQLVSRDDIVARVWGKDVFLDTDNSINSAIRKIRQVLKDDPENPIFIQTVTGRGYRFIAAVTEVSVLGIAQTAVADPDPELQTVESGVVVPHPSGRSYRRLNRIVPLVSLVVLLAAGAYLFWVRSGAPSATEAHRVRLVVLPFANLSNDPEQEYFSDGLTEETITDLGEINPERLGVIARTSSTAYKHTSKTITQIGQELGVDYVLEGSVRR